MQRSMENHLFEIEEPPEPVKEAAFLLPCPFCGGAAKAGYESCGHNDSAEMVECAQCPAKVVEYGGDVVKRWNTRH